MNYTEIVKDENGNTICEVTTHDKYKTALLSLLMKKAIEDVVKKFEEA